MSAQVILNVREGDRGGRLLKYGEPTVLTLGRGHDCVIVLPDPAEPPLLSRRHCELRLDPPRLWLRDLGSKNGTYLNGKKLDPTTLTSLPAETLGEGGGFPVVSGDVIEIGDIRIEVQVNIVRTQAEVSRIAEARKDSVPAVPGFDVERELGRGGMGVVFLARRSGEPVALKVILPEKAADERMRDLFMRELTLARQLKHPNIVRLIDAGEHQGALWMASEYCAAGTVEALQEQRGGRVPVPEAVDLVCQALTGLEHAHEVALDGLELEDGAMSRARGLVHRDFKPQNLLLGGASGRVVKIADYGLAKAYALAGLSGRTSTGQVGGTPYFMSRWQAVNYKYAGPEVDVWAAAATLYYLLTGMPARDFAHASSWMETVMKSLPVKIRTRSTDVPTPLAKVIDDALFDFEQPAYPTARRLRDALTAALAG